MFVLRILKLIGQDKAVLYPALIVEFLMLGLLPDILPADFGAPEKLLPQLPLLLSFALLGSGLQCFVCLFTAECARQVLIRPAILFGQTLNVTLRRLIPTMLCGALLALAYGFLLAALAIFLRFLPPGGATLSFWFLLPLVFLLMFALYVFPLFYVLSGAPVQRVYGLLILFFRRYPRRALQLLLFFLLLLILRNEGAYLLLQLPQNLKIFFLPLFNGFSTVFLFYGLTLLLQDNHRISELV